MRPTWLGTGAACKRLAPRPQAEVPCNVIPYTSPSREAKRLSGPAGPSDGYPTECVLDEEFAVHNSSHRPKRVAAWFLAALKLRFSWMRCSGC